MAVIAAGCTDGDAEQADETVSDESATESDEPVEAPAVDFCTEADAFINDRSITNVASFSAEFFEDVDRRLGRLIETAPDEIVGDVEALRAGFASSDEIFGEFDYDVTDERLGPALEEVDNRSMLDATTNIQVYLTDECDLEPVGSLDPQEVSDIMDAFGVDRALAECLNLELGDVANIDPEELTPELMSMPVCGTSLIALLTGGQPST